MCYDYEQYCQERDRKPLIWKGFVKRTISFLLLFPFGLDHGSSSSNLWMWCCLDLRFTHNNPFSVWKNKGLCLERHFVDVLSRFTWYDAANIVCVLCKLSTCNLWAMKAQLLPTYTVLHLQSFLGFFYLAYWIIIFYLNLSKCMIINHLFDLT